MGRNIRRRFGCAFAMVDSFWKESVVESMGILPADDCRDVLP